MAFSEDLHRDADMDFKAGIEFAESKVEEIAIEFAEYVRNNSSKVQDWKLELLDNDGNISGEAKHFTNISDLFEEFLKERNND